MTIAGSGIRFRHPSPYEHQQHGKAERKHRHIVELGLTLLAQASMLYPIGGKPFPQLYLL